MDTPRARRPWMRTAAALSALALLALGAPSAQAAPSASDKATAQVLFDDALKLFEKKQYKEACPKLEESLRLDPAMGTKYRLAECYEKSGRSASAWGLYREVADDAKAAGLVDREKKARERVAKLETKLSRLMIAVDPANGSNVKVLRDGSEVGTGQLGSGVPVDPGTHTIEASAPGRVAWTTTIEVGEKDSKSVTVPMLEAVPVVDEKKPPPPHKAVEPMGGSQRTVALIVGGIGVVSLGVSTGLILSAKGMVKDASPHCDGNACDPTGLDLRDRASARGNLASVCFGVGAAAIIAGSVLWFTGAPSEASPHATSASASLGVGPGWLLLRGRF